MSEDAQFEFATFPDSVETANVYAVIRSTDLEEGVYGWAVSASVDGDIDLVEVSLDGTAGAEQSDDPPGLRFHGFETTEIIDPERRENEGRRGCISAVYLSRVQPAFLPPTSTERVLRMTISHRLPPDESSRGSISWVDGLAGTGNPVQNRATVGGDFGPFCATQNAVVSFVCLGCDGVGFRRCDVNEDGRFDISDPIRALESHFLNLQRPRPECSGVSDCNGDLNVDLSDPIYALVHLYQGGAAPPAPYPHCGLIDDSYPDCVGYQGCL